MPGLVEIHYQKRKNTSLFKTMQEHPKLQLTNLQNYIPIYDSFFSLSTTNFNSFNLNHEAFLLSVQNKPSDTANLLTCRIGNTGLEGDEYCASQRVFFKMAPLLDPFKYVIGKYNHEDPHLFDLPVKPKSPHVHPKIADPGNSSYVDSFFSYLSSRLLHQHGFIHGLDFYGAFLGVQRGFSLNIIDDLDYLVKSDFFNRQKSKLFEVEDYSHLLPEEPRVSLRPIHISDVSLKTTFLDFDALEEELVPVSSLEPVSSTSSTLIDLTENQTEHHEAQDAASIKSLSTCSSRTSRTEESEQDEKASAEENDDDLDVDVDDEYDDEDDNEDDVESCEQFDEDRLTLTINEFPVQVICMEPCEDTLDGLVGRQELSTEEWLSALLQVIFSLIAYQKAFQFTHNDLHTNNVMYTETKQKHLYYCYQKKYYKVPTFGRIFKIIDFGRAIYHFQGKRICSDSFQKGGDADTQYNTEPYFNEKKPRIEPNPSFDLCRLACSIFDYLVDDFDDLDNLIQQNPVTRLIVEWCTDDNGLNVLYKASGIERYPDFKLYKMIARCVHNHTPQAQLQRPEFQKYIVTKKQVKAGDPMFDLDALPVY